MKGNRKTLVILGVLSALLVGCLVITGLGALVVLNGPALDSIVSGVSEALGLDKLADLMDDDYHRLLEALSERWNPDDSIPSADVRLEMNNYMGDESGAQVWLVIEVSYTGTCDATPGDPCEALVDELAQIVFDNYARVDELDGLYVGITNNTSLGLVEFSITPREKAFTIEEWRRELSIDDE